MKMGGVMDTKFFFEERWNNIESREGRGVGGGGESEIRNTYVHWLY
jgi:hypothetical protein